MYYNFFIIAILFSVPGIIIYKARPDLRKVINKVIPCAWPFACTEFLFYPSYWEPRFLFDLGSRVGCGIEDFIFVSGLAAYATTVYAWCCRRYYRVRGTATRYQIMGRCAVLFAVTFLLVVLAVTAGVPIIYASCVIMLAVAALIFVLRRDLIVPAVAGGVLSLVTYYMLCLVCLLVMPGLFQDVWHTEKFLNVFIGGVPLEELLYGFAAGVVATAFYPFVFSCSFTAQKEAGSYA